MNRHYGITAKNRTICRLKTTILDFQNIYGQARAMIKSGAQVLVASGGTYQELVPVIHEVPVLRLYLSTYDIIYALEQARQYKKSICFKRQCHLQTLYVSD